MKTSSTALEQYERCPHQYYQERVQKIKGQSTPAMQLGNVCHRTIERLMRKHREDGELKEFDATTANEFYTEEWGKEHGLSGEDLFTEGLQMIVNFIERWSPMDPARILAIEEWFEISVSPDDESEPSITNDADSEHSWDCPEHGPQNTPHCPQCHRDRRDVSDSVTIRGIIDLALSDEQVTEDGEVLRTIEIIDYKSTRAFLTTRDADSSLQLAIYDMAARKLWPDAAKYTCSLHMLQTSTHIQVVHEPRQLENYRRYVLATTRQIESEESWPTRLGPDCVWCHLRSECHTYKEALEKKSHLTAETSEDLEVVARERQEVALKAKIYKSRQDELDSVIKENLSRTKEPLLLAGEFFKLSQVETVEYDPSLVVELLQERLGIDPAKTMSNTMEVNKKRLETMLTDTAKEREGGLSAITMIKAALQNRSTRKYTTRMTHKKDKETHKSKKG